MALQTISISDASISEAIRSQMNVATEKAKGLMDISDKAKITGKVITKGTYTNTSGKALRFTFQNSTATERNPGGATIKLAAADKTSPILLARGATAIIDIQYSGWAVAPSWIANIGQTGNHGFAGIRTAKTESFDTVITLLFNNTPHITYEIESNGVTIEEVDEPTSYTAVTSGIYANGTKIG